jgi:hypothetical protein
LKPENWNAIDQRLSWQRPGEDHALLDKVQAAMGLADSEFLHLLSLVGAIAAASNNLKMIRLPSP